MGTKEVAGAVTDRLFIGENLPFPYVHVVGPQQTAELLVAGRTVMTEHPEVAFKALRLLGVPEDAALDKVLRAVGGISPSTPDHDLLPLLHG